MSLPQKPPPDKSYCFVLRTIRDYDPSIQRLASTHLESQHSLDIQHPDGKRKPTVFFSTQAGRDRLIKEGWEDVTHLWRHRARRADEPEAPKPEPTPPVLETITLPV